MMSWKKTKGMSLPVWPWAYLTRVACFKPLQVKPKDLYMNMFLILNMKTLIKIPTNFRYVKSKKPMPDIVYSVHLSFTVHYSEQLHSAAQKGFMMSIFVEAVQPGNII
jgi:hypothetical protein